MSRNEWSDYQDEPDDGSTEDPIEGEVSRAVACYKVALIYASYRNFWHRLSCKIGDEKALNNERMLVVQERECRRVVNQSDAHRDMLKTLINRQPPFVREKDKFFRLLQVTLDF